MNEPRSHHIPASSERALIEAARRQASELAIAGADDSPTEERCDCPPLDTLAAFEAGRLSEVEAETIRQHLRSCEACQVFVGAESHIDAAAETVSSDGGVTIAPSAPASPPNAPLPAAPRRLGQYEIREVLGRGGMGAVYKARHARLDKFVALKILPEERLEDPAAVERFEREMRAVGKLDHPNIAAAHDAGEFEGTHFLVMEYVDGVDLSALSRKLGPLPVAESCELIRQASLGLQHAHGRGLVHRDVKPSNLLLARSGENRPVLKVLDFGLALLEEQAVPGERDLTTATQFMGTWDYVAPEQALDTHHVDARADVYSLGATLYKLLTGDTPFPRERFSTPLQAMLAKTGAKAPSIQTLRQLPEELGRLVDRMLDRSPNGRPATAEEVAQAMAPFAREADLTTLLQSYDEAEDPARNNVRLPPGQSRMASDEATADFVLQAAAAQPQPSAVRNGNRRRMMTLLALVGMVLLCGVVLIIRDRDGKEKLRVQLEPGDGLELAENAGDEPERKAPAPKIDAAVAAGGNYALKFDGKSSYVAVPSLKYDGSHPITIEGWFVSHRNTKPSADHLVWRTIVGWDQIIQLHVSDNTNIGEQMPYGVAVNPVRQLISDSGTNVRCGTRFHAAMVWDGKQLVVYVNGRSLPPGAPLDAIVNPVEKPDRAGSNFCLGSSIPSKGVAPDPMIATYFEGMMDEVRISKTTRYTKDFTPAAGFEPDEHTLALYHFDEGTGDVLRDSSGNGHHGKIMGARWVKADDAADPIDRRVAQWVLDVGGTVKVRLASDEEITCGAADSLPADLFAVTEITFGSEAKVQDHELAQLAQLKNLWVLNLYDPPRLTKDCAAHVAKLESLVVLSLYGIPLDLQGFQEIAMLPNVKFLTLANMRVPADGPAAVARLPKLESLDFRNLEFEGDWSDSLKDSPHLRNLTIDLPKISDEAWQSLTTLENLVHLSMFVGSDIPPERLRQLGNMAGLRSLSIWDHRLDHPDLPTVEQLQAIAEIEQLTDLGFRCAFLTADHLAVLQEMPLNKLTLTNCRLAGVDLASLKFPALRTLDVRGTKLTDAQIAAVRKALPDTEILYDKPQDKAGSGDANGAAGSDHERAVAAWVLEHGGSITLSTASGQQTVSAKSGALPDEPFEVQRIDLSAAVDVKDDDLKRLTALRNLGVLTLGPFSQWTDAFTAHVAQIESLWALILVGCPITDEELKPLAKLPNLIQVSLQNVPITAAGIQTLAGFPALAHLDLRELDLQGAWCEPLKNASTLEDITFDMPQLNEEAWQSLLSCRQLTGLSFNARSCPPPARLQQLSRLPQLTTLMIWEYPLRTTDLPTLEQWHAIGQLKQLKKVVLDGVHVTTEGLEALAPLELEELKLYLSRLESVDLAPLEQHKKLKVLNLNKTGASAQAVAALRKALPETKILYDGP